MPGINFARINYAINAIQLRMRNYEPSLLLSLHVQSYSLDDILGLDFRDILRAWPLIFFLFLYILIVYYL